MQHISSKEVVDVRYTLGSPESAAGMFNQLKATFPEGKEYRLFAEPIISGGKIMWMTEYEGSLLNISQLSDEQQSNVKNLLTEKIKKLIVAAKQYDETKLVEFLYKCIEIPSLKDIFVVRNNNIDQVVLIQWGFLSDVPGADKGILDKIINAKKVPMVFKVRYEDETIAKGVEVSFEFEGKKEIHRSNEEGVIMLEEVKIAGYVKAYELYQNQAINMQGYTCYEYGDYVITVMLRLDMLFRVKGSNDLPMPNEKFLLKYDESETELTTNESGEFMLPQVPSGKQVSAWQTEEGKIINSNNFIADKEKEFYLIVIEIPEEEVVAPPSPVVEEEKTHDMKFKVIDNKNNVIADAEVKVRYGTNTQTLFTDSEGYAVLKGVELGTKVEVVAYKKKKKK